MTVKEFCKMRVSKQKLISFYVYDKKNNFYNYVTSEFVDSILNDECGFGNAKIDKWDIVNDDGFADIFLFVR